jgi:hypothetical protein
MSPYDDDAYPVGRPPLTPSQQAPVQPAYVQGNPQPPYRVKKRQGGNCFLWGCGCLVIIVVLTIACCGGIMIFAPSPEPMDGTDYSTEVDELFSGDGTLAEEYVVSLGPDRRGELVLAELESSSDMLDFYVDSKIPPEMLEGAMEVCNVPEDEQILGLIDATVLDTGENVMLFGRDGIYFNNSFIGEPPGAGTWGYGRFPVTQCKASTARGGGFGISPEGMK